jgi:hypothetical protein
MKSDDPVMDLLNDMMGQSRTLTIPRSLITLTGDINTALLLSQVIYWSHLNRAKDGWFYKSYEEWEVEISLSKHEVARSADRLTAAGVISFEKRRVNGAPTLFYQFSISGFRKWIVKKGEMESEKTGDQIVKKPEIQTQKMSSEEDDQNMTLALGSSSENLIPQEDTPNPEENIVQEDTPPPTPAPPATPIETAIKIVTSRLKRLRGMRSLPKPLRDLIATRMGDLDEDGVERALSALDDFERDGFWLEYDPRHRVNAFFAYAADFETPASPAPCPRLDITPRAAAPIPPPKPAGPPDEVDTWNEVVTSGKRVDRFDWTMPEGGHLRACREHGSFTLDAWREVCEKAQSILASGNPKAVFLNFHWLIKSNGNWWRVLSGQYDSMKNMAASTGGEPDYVQRLREKARARERKD